MGYAQGLRMHVWCSLNCWCLVDGVDSCIGVVVVVVAVVASVSKSVVPYAGRRISGGGVVVLIVADPEFVCHVGHRCYDCVSCVVVVVSSGMAPSTGRVAGIVYPLVVFCSYRGCLGGVSVVEVVDPYSTFG